VSAGDTIRVPLIRRDVGETFVITEVLAVRTGDDVTLGRPVVENARVTAEILEHGRSKKVIVYKKKRRKGYQVKKGHRQGYTLLRIRGIEAAAAERSD
jgi:large subunit ribosomal protein L21